MISILAFLFLSVVFIIIGLLKSKPMQTNSEFFVMDRSATSGDYLFTSIAYSLQVTTTVYFVYWGFVYGWSNLIFIINWIGGLILYSAISPKLISELKKSETMFGVIFGKSKIFRGASVIIFGLSLAGFLYTELFFASQFISAGLKVDNQNINDQFFWIVISLLLIFVFMYAAIGGMRKVILTDKIQLSIAYISFAILLVSLLSFGKENYPASAKFLGLSSFIILFFIATGPFLILKTSA